MILMEDTRQQANKHILKHRWFDTHGIEVIRGKMLVGDYCLPNKTDVSVDTKQGLQEVYGNLIQDHERFRAEADLAVKAGIKLYVLVEEFKCTKLEDVKNWRNPRYINWMKINAKHKQGEMLWRKIPPKPPASSGTLYKIMKTMQDEHGVHWVFCKPDDAGEMIVKLLTEGGDVDGKTSS